MSLESIHKALSEMEEREKAASPGPWVWKPDHGNRSQHLVCIQEIVPEYHPSRPLVTLSITAWKPERYKSAKPNAAFIAHSRQDLPKLIKALRVAVGKIGDHWGGDPRRVDEDLAEISSILSEAPNG